MSAFIVAVPSKFVRQVTDGRGIFFPWTPCSSWRRIDVCDKEASSSSGWSPWEGGLDAASGERIGAMLRKEKREGNVNAATFLHYSVCRPLEGRWKKQSISRLEPSGRRTNCHDRAAGYYRWFVFKRRPLIANFFASRMNSSLPQGDIMRKQLRILWSGF